MTNAPVRLVVVTGLSGAGKSVTMHALEDLGYYCVDNLPLRLLPDLARELQSGDAAGATERAAVGVDARMPRAMLGEFPRILGELREEGVLGEVVFLEASSEVLLKRFSETRRRHPLTAGSLSLAEALREERMLLEPVRELADVRIDTTGMHLHQLRDLIWNRVGGRPPGSTSLLFLSFGYKHGVPDDADMVFDARCLPNPHWEPGLRSLTGRDEEVIAFLEKQSIVRSYVESLAGFLDTWVPRFESDGRTYFTVAIGCTGGQHRSVYVAEALARRYRDARPHVVVRHRDMR